MKILDIQNQKKIFESKTSEEMWRYCPKVPLLLILQIDPKAAWLIEQ